MPKNPPATIMPTRRAIFFPDNPENNGVSEFESGAYDTNNQTIENLKIILLPLFRLMLSLQPTEYEFEPGMTQNEQIFMIDIRSAIIVTNVLSCFHQIGALDSY